jgi:hypothetical protein
MTNFLKKPAFLLSIAAAISMSSHSLHAAEPNWQSLFDGKTMSGWTALDGKAPGKGWQIEEGIIHLKGQGGNLISTEEFSEFELEWEWKIAPGANNGLKYWVTKMGNDWLGIEYQMIDDGVSPDGKIGSSHATASFYDIKAAPTEKPLKQAGEWNISRVISRNGVVEHHLNGKLVVSADTKSPEWKTQVTASKFKNKPEFAPGKGRIMLTDHQSEAWYRNIRIRNLAEK